jgi:hypothetical protein
LNQGTATGNDAAVFQSVWIGGRAWLERATVAAALAKVKPDDGSGRSARWRLLSALAALHASIPVQGHPLNQPAYAKGKAAAPDRAARAFLAARAAVLKERARILAIKRAELEGSLPPVTEVRDVCGAIITMIKARSLALPSRLAGRFDKSIAPMIQTLADETVRDWLQEMADTLRSAGKSGWRRP